LNGPSFESVRRYESNSNRHTYFYSIFRNDERPSSNNFRLIYGSIVYTIRSLTRNNNKRVGKIRIGLHDTINKRAEQRSAEIFECSRRTLVTRRFNTRTSCAIPQNRYVHIRVYTWTCIRRVFPRNIKYLETDGYSGIGPMYIYY